jgi:hypothetical protein
MAVTVSWKQSDGIPAGMKIERYLNGYSATATPDKTFQISNSSAGETSDGAPIYSHNSWSDDSADAKNTHQYRLSPMNLQGYADPELSNVLQPYVAPVTGGPSGGNTGALTGGHLLTNDQAP